MTDRLKGRIAGLVYLGVVVTGIFTLAFMPGKLITDGDASATAAAIAANFDLFSAANYALLAMCAFFLALPFMLSRFLSPFGPNAARAMILLVAASIPFTLLAAIQHFEIASLVAGGVSSAEEIGSRLAAYDEWMKVSSIFWGLWLAPLGWLILKSGAIPRVLGVLLIIGCFGYLVKYFGPMLYEGYAELPFRKWISMPGSLGEIGTCIWLLVMGARSLAAAN